MQQAQAQGAKGSIKSCKPSFEDDVYIYIYIYIYLFIYLSSRTSTHFNDLEQD
jgi:hypothetical protein